MGRGSLPSSHSAGNEGEKSLRLDSITQETIVESNEHRLGRKRLLAIAIVDKFTKRNGTISHSLKVSELFFQLCRVHRVIIPAAIPGDIMIKQNAQPRDVLP